MRIMGSEALKTSVAEIGRYGAAVLSVSEKEYLEAGFCPGDIVTVTVGGKTFTVPSGTAYSDVDSHKPLLLKIALCDNMILAENNASGFAEKNGIRPGDAVAIAMAEKGGYLAEYRLRSVQMSGNREDYASDEEFANFRYVTAGAIAPKRLYRGFSPINPADNRNRVADRLLSETGVRTAINLDNEDLPLREKYEGYQESHYAGLTVVPVKMSFSPAEPYFQDGIRKVFRAIAENEGPYYIHCRYSRDRTGLACALLEASCGASLQEIIADYMLSYENIHHLERYSEKWDFQARQHVIEVFKSMLDLETGEIGDRVREMLLTECGIEKEVLLKVNEKLCGG